jgi:hypothetical protein
MFVTMSIRAQKTLLVAITLLSAFNIFILLNNLVDEFSVPTPRSASAAQPTQMQPAPLKAWPKDLVLSELRLIVDPNDGQKYIVGTVTNHGTQPYRYVETWTTLLDQSGNVVDVALDDCRDLQPGKAWRFKIYIPRKVTSYHIRKLNGQA